MNYPHSNILDEGPNRSSRRVNATSLAAIAAFIVALALYFWGD